jgi:EF-P beta-lysylation protein EpmB
MIPRTALTLHTGWQEELRHLITSTDELFALLALDTKALPSAIEASRHFPIRVPRAYAARIRKGDPNDPLLLQVLPLGAELIHVDGFTNDPVGDMKANVIPGLLHKYEGRVLLITSGSCAINCRYCFRRDFAYEDNNPGRLAWEQALTYIRQDSSISEVILSGGDPLVSSNKQLAWLIDGVSTIPHIARLRIHTRLPIVIPSRVDEALLSILAGTRLPTAFVIHCNHAQEIDAHVFDCLQALKQIPSVTLLNQSVLLKGVNDTAQTLIDLSQALFKAGVLPYYLHMLDKAKGTAHFAVSDQHATTLMQTLLTKLPGYLIPKLVREEAGHAYKTPFIPNS